jgi:hypothetical protein
MNSRYTWLLGLSLTVLLMLVLVTSLVAADKPSTLMNIQGKVQMLDRSASTLTVEMKGGVRRRVAYTNDTKFLYGHSNNARLGSPDQVKESNYVSCAGTYGNDKTILNAKECIYREMK